MSCMYLVGNLWANDENKFGHKLMEKMGWEKGKGLGANQVHFYGQYMLLKLFLVAREIHFYHFRTG